MEMHDEIKQQLESVYEKHKDNFEISPDFRISISTTVMQNGKSYKVSIYSDSTTKTWRAKYEDKASKDISLAMSKALHSLNDYLNK